MGLYTLIPVKRELLKFDEARVYFHQLLNLNHESAYSYATAAKVELKAKKDDEALKYALKSLELSPDDAYIYSTLILAYHLKEILRKRLLSKSI